MPFVALFGNERGRFQRSKMFVFGPTPLASQSEQAGGARSKGRREMSREINEAHSAEVTLQKQSREEGATQRERERTPIMQFVASIAIILGVLIC